MLIMIKKQRTQFMVKLTGDLKQNLFAAIVVHSLQNLISLVFFLLRACPFAQPGNGHNYSCCTKLQIITFDVGISSSCSVRPPKSELDCALAKLSTITATNRLCIEKNKLIPRTDNSHTNLTKISVSITMKRIKNTKTCSCPESIHIFYSIQRL